MSLYQHEQNMQREAENYDFPEPHGWYLEDEFGQKHFNDYFDNAIDEDSQYIEARCSKYDLDFIKWDDLYEYLDIICDINSPREDDEDYLKGFLDAVVGHNNWIDVEQEKM